MTHYERIARVIRHLDEGFREQPDLAELASVAGISRYHLHRLFAEWAGITPKDFLQSVTHNYARDLLRNGVGVLETALESGLSGPSRLHDLCIGIEAVTPGELKSGGAGLVFRYGFAPSPFGLCLIARSERGVAHLSFHSDKESPAASASLEADWPGAHFERDDAGARRLVEAIFNRGGNGSIPRERKFRALVRGSEFQIRVWRALLQVPAGSAVSYGRLARAVEAPLGARAVGRAIGSNSIAFLIPCHRVIRETGALGGYRWGTERKRAMLAWERPIAGDG